MLKKNFITGGIALAVYVLNSMRKEFDKNVVRTKIFLYLKQIEPRPYFKIQKYG